MNKATFTLAVLFFTVINSYAQQDSIFYKGGKVITGTIANFEDFRVVQFNLKQLSFKLKENKKEKITTENLERVSYQGVTYVPAPYDQNNYKLMLPVTVGKVSLYIFSGEMQTGNQSSGMSMQSRAHSISFYSLVKGGKSQLLQSKFDSEYYFKNFKMGEYTTKGINISNLYADKSNAKRIEKSFDEYFGDCKSLKQESLKPDFNFADIIGIVNAYNECK
jgi:hypothetical protein